MLAYCLEDGLTCNRQVFRRGQIFILPSSMEAEFGGLSAPQLVTKQRSVYGRELFRFPTSEEILTAYQTGKIGTDIMSEREALIVARWKESKSARETEAARVLRESIEDKHPELKEEEDEPTAFELQGAEVETPPVPEVKTTPAKPSAKPTRRTTSKKTKK